MIERTIDGLTKEGRCDDPLTNDENVTTVCVCDDQDYMADEHGGTLRCRRGVGTRQGGVFSQLELSGKWFNTYYFGVSFQRRMIGENRIDLDTFQT